MPTSFEAEDYVLFILGAVGLVLEILFFQRWVLKKEEVPLLVDAPLMSLRNWLPVLRSLTILYLGNAGFLLLGILLLRENGWFVIKDYGWFIVISVPFVLSPTLYNLTAQLLHRPLLHMGEPFSPVLTEHDPGIELQSPDTILDQPHRQAAYLFAHYFFYWLLFPVLAYTFTTALVGVIFVDVILP